MKKYLFDKIKQLCFMFLRSQGFTCEDGDRVIRPTVYRWCNEEWKIRTIRCHERINLDFLKYENQWRLMDYTKKHLIHEIAKGIYEYATITETRDHKNPDCLLIKADLVIATKQ